MTDYDSTTKPAGSGHGDETFEWTETSTNGGATAGAADKGREWLSQLQTMIENAATQAAPVMREVAAKAAELAAVAGEKAGPVAAKAAELTAEAGAKIAEKGRDLAAELRRDQAAADDISSDATATTAGSTDAGTPGTNPPA